MNTQTLTLRCRSLALLGLMAALVLPAAADSVTWTNAVGVGGAGASMEWSNAGNWTNSVGANVVPGAADDVRFEATGSRLYITGATNAPGLVNNIVSSSTTIGSLVYLAYNPGYHTTLLNPGVTLSIGPASPTAELFTFRHGFTTTTNLIGYITITGAGTVAVGDTVSPGTASGSLMRVHATSTHANSAALATLDMSGLDNFSVGLAEIKIGGQGAGQATRGRLILAKTNLVVAAFTGTGNVGFLIGNSTGTTTGDTTDSFGDVQLGQINEIRVNNLKVGGSRTSLGTLKFQTGLSLNPTLKLRDSTGNTTVNFFSIGDNFDGPNNANYNAAVSTGVVDLTGGIVDALVDNLVVGRNLNLSSTSRNVSGNGTLTWTAGNINANTMNVGVQAVNNAGSAVGVVNVRSNATLFANALNMGGDVGTAAGTGNGTLNIAYGGQATVTNSILETNAGANSGTSQINITNGTLTVGGTVRADVLVAQSATLNLTVTPTNSLANPVWNFTNSVSLLSAVSLNVSGAGLTLTKYPLIKYPGSLGGGGFGVVSLGSVPANTGGYLTNNTATGTIDLVITNVPGAKWNGNVNGNWDINTTANWINTATSVATTYKETSFPGDPVIFDDSATGTKTVNVTTTVVPAIVALNNTATYTFIGAGRITGPMDLYKNGSGLVEFANAGPNDYSGQTVVGGGTLRVNTSLASGGPVTIQSGATLAGTGVISGPVTISSAATLAAGNGNIGLLTVNSSVLLSAGSTNIFDVNSDTLEHDQVNGFGGVTYGGTLVLNLSGSGTALTNGAAIQLFGSAVSGTFATIVPVAPAPGYYWDTNTLGFDGIIRVQAIPVGSLLIWTNAVGGNINWSNPANWIRTNPAYVGSFTPNSAPTPADSLLFGDTYGLTNGPDLVNNIVDTSQTISNYTYEATTNHGYHTTLLQPGVTLTVDSSQLSGNEFNFNIQRAVGQNEQMYATVKGTNASLVIGQPFVANTSFGLSVYATSTNTDPSVSSHRATLNLAGLDNFSFWGGFVLVGGSGSPGGNDQPSGTILLAKTNILIAGRSVGVSAAGTIRIGNCLTGNGTGAGENLLELGQENTVCGEYLRVGGAQALNGGAMRFRAGMTNPTLKLRAPDQVSRMQLLTVGDNNATITTIPSTGVVDLSGGIVDALVDVIHVGRSYTTADATRNGSGNGTLTFSGGTLDVTTLNIGCQSANNLGSATGGVNIANSGQLLAANINIGNDTGTRSGTGNGTLNLTGGATANVTGNITETSSGGDGSSTINLNNGYLAVGGTVTVDTINATSGTISNTGLMTVGTLRGNGTIGGSVTVTTNLAPGTSIGTMTIVGNLVLSATSSNVFEVNTDTLAHDLATGMASVTYGGTLVISPSGIGSAVTNGASAQLFNAASYSGSFAAIVPAIPAPGFAWDTTQLTVNGTLKIVASVNTTPINLTFFPSGNTLDISWPADHLGWTLQGQTNAPGAGISTNWFPVAGSTTTNHIVMPVNPANGTVFYRLVYP